MEQTTVELLEKAKAIVKRNEKEMAKVEWDQGQAENLHTLEFDGMEIFDVFSDTSLRFAVDPIAYYGKETIENFVNTASSETEPSI